MIKFLLAGFVLGLAFGLTRGVLYSLFHHYPAMPWLLVTAGIAFIFGVRHGYKKGL